MSKRPKQPSPVKDDADRAIAQIHGAVCQLIEIAGGHPDVKLVTKAVNDLKRLGSLAAAPLREAIDRFPGEERRVLLVTLLGGVAPMSDMATVIRLTELMATDPSERVRAAALETLGLLRRRVRERREARASKEVGDPEARPEGSVAASG